MLAKHKGLLAAFGCMALAAVGLSIAGAPSPAAQDAARAAGAREIQDALPAAGELRDLALAYDARIASLEEQARASRETLLALQQALSELAGALERAHAPFEPEPSRTPEAPPRTQTEQRLLVLDLKPDTGVARPLRVPAGSFGEATLLTGVFAPVNGDPMPVLVRLDAVLTGPNRTRAPIQGAFLVGKAVGDANSARAVIQLAKVSVGAEERAVNGWVVDDDGVQGLAGRYVWNAGQLAALSAASGFAQGASQALSQAQTSTVVSPFGSVARDVTGDPARFAGSAGAAAAFAHLSKLLEERMQEFVPAVYVHNRARRITVVFLEGFDIPAPPEPPSKREHNLGGFDR
jgi:hypothetical protein